MKPFILNITKQLTILFIVMASISIAACKSIGSAAITDPQAGTPLLLFQKTPCLGTCPSYEALIYTNGNVRFVPWDHVPATDTLNFQLKENELKELTKNIANLNYKTMENLYKTDWSDMPGTHLYFYESGKQVKHIKHEEGGPKALVLFNDKVHKLLWKYVATPAR